MAFHISDMCFLWPCPKCFKAARKGYKKKLKQQIREQEEEKKKKAHNKSPAWPPRPPTPPIQISRIKMDPYQHGWNFLNQQHPLMDTAPNEATKGCECTTCRNVRKQARPSGKAPPKPPPKPTSLRNDSLNNLGFPHIPPALNHHHLQGPVPMQPRFTASHGNPSRHHAVRSPPPGYNSQGAQNVYIWHCGVSHISFPIVDYTRSSFAATGFPGPHFYMATVPNSAQISDLVARLAPAGSGKALMARAQKGGECFEATEAAGVIALQRRTLQLEVWAKDDVDDNSDDHKSEGQRVASSSTNQTTRKKSKGKKPTLSSSPETFDDDDDDDDFAELVDI
ncbi:hypothetical protein PG994_002257 [Apiospora phragmitis]|uniref:Uncharacterized protein n=1 Tax=Apiospora phragmitis TaxID=2905665 RepID=A0ABR1WVY0_9PEZI